MPLDLFCSNEEKIKVTCAPRTAAGNPAPLDGQLSGRVVSGTGTVEPVSGDPKSVWVISGSDPGDTSYVIEADADLGSGVQLIQDTVVLHVAGAMASSLSLQAGMPELK